MEDINYDEFNKIKTLIIEEMTYNAPIIFLDYNYEKQKLLCRWKKLNKDVSINNGELIYNQLNPYEWIFLHDFGDKLFKCYHLLNLLYMDFLQGNKLLVENYIVNDKVAVDHIANRYKVLCKE